jgi:molecular chaperone GrpE
MKKKDHEPQPTDEPLAATPPADELAALRDERDRLEDQLRRAMADLANIRKRHSKELDEARARAIEAMAGELLPVLDNFHLALAAHEQHETGDTQRETHSIIEGVKMVRSLLEGVLERHGLAEIGSEGEVFDPSRHEAVGVDPDAQLEPGRVSRVLLRGYAFQDRVLRPTKVHVAGASSDTPPPADPEKDADEES